MGPHTGLVLVIVMILAFCSIVALRARAHQSSTGFADRTLPSRDDRLITWRRAGGLAGLAIVILSLSTPLRSTPIGMNVPAINYWDTTAPFANLLIGPQWLGPDWKALDPKYIAQNGDLIGPDGGKAIHFLVRPPTGPGGTDISCTFSGSGELSVFGAGTSGGSGSRGKFRFHFVNDWKSLPYIVVTGIKSDNPFRNLDCREAGLAPTVRFRPHFVETLKGYKVLRFMDWQHANANIAVPWSKRRLPTDTQITDDGVSIEDMMELAAQVGADPWFVMPWNADDAYIEGFAKLVHEKLPPNRHVYVEVGNEVWNLGFSVAKQARDEGLRAGFATESRQAQMRRYAERTIEVMKIWENAFPDRKRLVRVISTQHVVPFAADIALSFRDTATHVDALATAPYFGPMKGGAQSQSVDSIIDEMKTSLASIMVAAEQNKAIALKHHLRYIAYEGGQGAILYGAAERQKQVQRDPRMYDLYKAFLRDWNSRVGDVLCLLTATAPIGDSAWGLNEYEGQPASEAPKLRAVLEER